MRKVTGASLRLGWLWAVAVFALAAPASAALVQRESSASVLPSLQGSVWSVIASPNIVDGSDGLYDNALDGVSGDAPNDVWAVGDDCCYPNGSQEYTHSLIEHYDGKAWRIIPAAKDEPADSQLHAVAAISSKDAWAVGNAPYPDNQALIEHWNGKTWSVVSSPHIANNAELLSIVAIAPNNVWAAGEGNDAAILEHWDGTQWSFVPGLTMGGLTILTSITATGPNDIMAVGNFFMPNANLFAEHWNGATWSFAAPVNTFYVSDFAGVTAASPKDMWAVGYERATETSQVPQTLTEHWNGSQWSLVRSPNRDPKNSYPLLNELNGVVARSSHDVWAVGLWTWFQGDGTPRSLFEHWNGTAWRVEPGPPALESANNEASNGLLSIAGLPSGGLWSVGNQSVPGQCCSQTLTVQAP